MSRVGKFLNLPRGERGILVRSAIIVLAIRLGLCLLPLPTFRRLLARAHRGPARLRGGDMSSLKRIARAVTRTSRYVPGARSCLTQALTAQVLLGLEGRPACLRIGVARAEGGRLRAHAWVESEGLVVVGGRDLEHYTPLGILK